MPRFVFALVVIRMHVAEGGDGVAHEAGQAGGDERI